MEETHAQLLTRAVRCPKSLTPDDYKRLGPDLALIHEWIDERIAQCDLEIARLARAKRLGAQRG